MKETEKIFNQVEEWSRAEGTDHASVVIMADMATNDVHLLCYGTPMDLGRLVTHWMNSDKATARIIYAAACLYAHEHIEAKERKKVNEAASASLQKMNSAG